MELETDVGVDADTEVVVHDDHASLVLGVVHGGVAVGRFGLAGGRLGALFFVEDDGPAVEADLLGLDDVLENIEGIFLARIAATPAKDARQVVAGSERYDAARRREARRVLLRDIQTLQHPPDRSISPARQNLVLGNVTKYVQPAMRTF